MNNSEREMFWKTLCELDGNDLNADSKKLQATIKYPSTICRFRSITMASLEALQTNKLYFSSAYYYDDPFDTYLSIDWHSIKETLEKSKISSQEQFYNSIELCKQLGYPTDGITYDRVSALGKEQIFESLVYNLAEVVRPQLQKFLFSIAFAENPLNENLWLKYANSHKGFCLEYSLCDDSALLIKEGSNYMSLYPVYYSNEKYDATRYAMSILSFWIIGTKNLDAAKTFQQHFPMRWESEKVSLIKHKCHEYDAEWRIISHANERNCIIWKPARIYIGLKTELSEKRLIVRAAVAAGIKHIYQVIVSPTDELDVKELNKQEIENHLQ